MRAVEQGTADDGQIVASVDGFHRQVDRRSLRVVLHQREALVHEALRDGERLDALQGRDERHVHRWSVQGERIFRRFLFDRCPSEGER